MYFTIIQNSINVDDINIGQRQNISNTTIKHFVKTTEIVEMLLRKEYIDNVCIEGHNVSTDFDNEPINGFNENEIGIVEYMKDLKQLMIDSRLIYVDISKLSELKILKISCNRKVDFSNSFELEELTIEYYYNQPTDLSKCFKLKKINYATHRDNDEILSKIVLAKNKVFRRISKCKFEVIDENDETFGDRILRFFRGV